MTHRLLACVLVASLSTNCGPGTPTSDASVGMDGSRNDAGGPSTCTTDTDCDDGIDCTEDACDVVGGACRHTVVPALCPPGSSCHPARGCEMGRACADDTDCEDEDACTVNERCNRAARACVVDPLDGDADGVLPGVCGGGDCDDDDAAVHPTARERCNGADDDCDGIADEDCGDTSWERLWNAGDVAALAVDSDVVYVVGSFTEALELGSATLMSAGDGDGFLIALARDGGALRWWKQIGAELSDSVLSVSFDADHNVFIAGRATGSVDLGGGPITDAPSFFVASYTATGDHRWSRRVGNASASVRAIVVGSAGNLYLTGSYTRPVDFGGGTLPTYGGYTDIFVLSLTQTGEHRWSRGYGAADYDMPRALAIDASNNVSITGYFQYTVDFGGGPLASERNSQDGFVLSLDSNGAHRWSTRFGAEGDDSGAGIMVDRAGNVQVAGTAFGADFGGGALTENSFLASFTTDGAHRWSIGLPNPGGGGGPEAVADDGAGNTVVVGHFSDIIDLGGGTLMSEGGSDIFCAVYDTTGAHRFSARFGGAAYDQASAVADGRHSFFIGGSVMGAGYIREVVP